MDRHVLAAVSIAGVSLDLLGGMYLAYDLLGGKHGPLRTLTRAVTYSVLYGLGFGLPLGWRFGLAVGLTNGFTLAVELSRAARQQPDYGLAHDSLFSLIRGAGFGLGLHHNYGTKFAITFAILSTVGQIIAYSRGVRPTMQYQAMARPRITRRQAAAALVRTVGYLLAALISGLLAQGTYSIGFCTGDWSGDRSRDCIRELSYSLHRMVRRQSAGTSFGSFRGCTYSLGLLSAIHSVLGGVAGCAAAMRPLSLS